MPLDPLTAAAGVAGALIGSAGTFFATRRTNETNLRIAKDRLEAEHRVDNAAAHAIRTLLLHPEYKQRSFDTISRRVRGFEGDELRKMLVAAGAVSFVRPRDGAELWGLIERNLEALSSDGTMG